MYTSTLPATSRRSPLASPWSIIQNIVAKNFIMCSIHGSTARYRIDTCAGCGDPHATNTSPPQLAHSASTAHLKTLLLQDPDFTATTTQASAKTLRFSLADAGSPAAWPALETVGGAACRATLPPAVAHAPGRSQHTLRAAPGVEPSGAALTVTSAVGGEAAAVALTVDSECAPTCAVPSHTTMHAQCCR